MPTIHCNSPYNHKVLSSEHSEFANYKFAVVEPQDSADDQPNTTRNQNQPSTQSNPGTEPSNVGLKQGSLGDDTEDESNIAPVEKKNAFAFNLNAAPFVSSAEESVPTQDVAPQPLDDVAPRMVHAPYAPLKFDHVAAAFYPKAAVYRFDDPLSWKAIHATSPKEFFEFPTENDGRHGFKFCKKNWKDDVDMEMVGINLGGVSAVDKRHAVFAAGILGVVTGVQIYDVLAQGTGTVRFFIRKVDLKRFVRLSKRFEFNPDKKALGTWPPSYWLRSLCNGDVAVGCSKFLVDAIHRYHGGRDCPKHPQNGCPGKHFCCPTHTVDISMAYDGSRRIANRKNLASSS